MKPRRFEQHRSKSSMMCNRFSDFNMKSDEGKTPLIVLRCADNRQLFEGTGKGNGKAMKIKVTWIIQGMEFDAIADTVAEAYEYVKAIVKAEKSRNFPNTDETLSEYIGILAKMKNGETIKHENHIFRIEVI